MITVSYSQLACYNSYLRLYANAMAGHGIVPGPILETSKRFLDENVGRVQAIHVQWSPESLWRPRWAIPNWRFRIRALAKFWWYLRYARRLGYKIVWTLHDTEKHEGNEWGDGVAYRLLARYTDLCICHDANAARAFTNRFGGRASGVCIMPHGNYDQVRQPPQRTRTETLASLGLDPTKSTFLCQGAIRPYKRYDLAIEAFRRLGPSHQLIIAGVGEVPETVAQIKLLSNGLSNVCLSVGYVDEQMLADLSCASDGYLLPYSQITGSGALLTALTHGRGVICSHLPFFTEMLGLDSTVGVTFQTDSADGLCDAIRAYLAVPPDARGRAARSLADRFRWENVIHPVVAWYRETFPAQLSVEQPHQGGSSVSV